MHSLLKQLVLLLLFWMIAGSTRAAVPEKKEPHWAATVYAGQNNRNDFLKLIRFDFGEYDPYWILAIALNKTLYLSENVVALEWGSHFVKHWERGSLFEVDQLLVARWLWFPWQSFLPTTLAMGEGLSLATGHPTPEAVQGIRSILMNYLLVEITLALPQFPQWALSTRLHHRSTVFGVFGKKGGSNYICFGLTKKF